MGRASSGMAVRLATEALVVILSILAAFQLEEWREGRAAFRVETAQLDAIRDDLLETRIRMDTVLTLQRRVVESARLLSLIHAGALPTPPADSVASLIGRAGSWWRLEPVTSAYEALVSSGDVMRLSSRALLGELASFYSDLNIEFEDQAESMALLNEMRRIQMPYGLGVLPAGALENWGGIGWLSESAISDLVRDPRHAHLVFMRGGLEMNRVELYERLDLKMERLLELLDSELARRRAT